MDDGGRTVLKLLLKTIILIVLWQISPALAVVVGFFLMLKFLFTK
jgi:hypothetical protein